MIFLNTNNPILIDELNIQEKKLGFIFPEDYKDFLLNYNGGKPEKNACIFPNGDAGYGTLVDCLFGFCDDEYISVVENYFDYKNRIPSNTFPIGEDPGGNLLLISIRGDDYGSIYFWDHNLEAGMGEEPDYSNMTFVAHSFDEFINNLKDESEIDD